MSHSNPEQSFPKRSSLKSCANGVVALFTILAFLGIATIYDVIPRHWIPRPLQPRSWRESQEYFEVDRSDLPLLYSESFDNPVPEGWYSDTTGVTLANGRLRFFFDYAPAGQSVQLPGEYELFSLAFSVYPIGEMFDESVNILYEVNEEGWYEIWIRLRDGSIFAFETSRSRDYAWTELTVEDLESEAIVLGPRATRIQLDVEVGEHILYINGKRAAVIKDPSEPFSSGHIEIGAGAGQKPNVGVEIDNIEIRAR